MLQSNDDMLGSKYMMRILSLVGLLILIASCNNPNEDCCAGAKKVELGEPFSINEGETIDVENSIIDLTFSTVIEDSLCPNDVECVTQGTLKISVSINGTDRSLSIGDISNPTTQFNDYTIELQKLIYPVKQAEKGNSNSTYAVQMMITRT